MTVSDDGGLTFRPQTDGNYYLTARGGGVFDGAGYSNIGTYAVSARETTDDAPEGLGTAVWRDPGYGGVAGTLESSGDRDSIALEPLAPVDHVIEVRGAAAQGALQRPTLRVFDAAGTLLAADDNLDRGPSAQVTIRPMTADFAKGYYVTIGGVGSDTGTYWVGERSPRDDYAYGPATAGVLAVGGSTAGNIEVEQDEDSFRVSLQAGHKYEFTLSGRWDGRGTLQEGSLGITDAAGEWLGNTTLPDEVLTLEAKTDGAYYLLARGETFVANDVYFSSGTYVVRATDTGQTFPFSTFSFDRSSLQVKESDGTATLTVKLDKPLQTAAAISYTAYSGTATVFDDFDRKSERLTFAAGELSKTISVPILNDTLGEGDESFTVVLSNPSGANLTSTTATVTITDDDVTSRPQFADARIARRVDIDGDGYARQFDIEFDVEATGMAPASYYFKIYEDDGVALLDDYLTTSSTFTVVGSSTEYQRITIKADDYPDVDQLGHGTAELRLDLHDATTDTLVKTWRAADDPDLGTILVEPSNSDQGIPVTVISPSGEHYLDGLLALSKWGEERGTGATVTYSFPKARASWSAFYSNEPNQNFLPLDKDQRSAVRKVLNGSVQLIGWDDFAGVTLEPVIENGDNYGEMTFAGSSALTSPTAYAETGYPTDRPFTAAKGGMSGSITRSNGGSRHRDSVIRAQCGIGS